jgi:hypothetical protein
MLNKSDSRITTLLDEMRAEHKRLTLLGDYNAEAGHIITLLGQVIALGEIVEEVEKLVDPLRILKDSEAFASHPPEKPIVTKPPIERVVERRVAGLVLPKG